MLLRAESLVIPQEAFKITPQTQLPSITFHGEVGTDFDLLESTLPSTNHIDLALSVDLHNGLPDFKLMPTPGQMGWLLAYAAI